MAIETSAAERAFAVQAIRHHIFQVMEKPDPAIMTRLQSGLLEEAANFLYAFADGGRIMGKLSTIAADSVGYDRVSQRARKLMS